MGDVTRSGDVAQAAWIVERISPPRAGVAGSVIPGGFSAYTRLLHPVAVGMAVGAPVRWADVAAWSGVELAPGIHFVDLTLPEHEPSAAEPWPGRVPRIGTLDIAEVGALGSTLARHTRTPDRCWFCMWDGWGPISHDDGLRVSIPGRDYLLFAGPLDALPSLMEWQEGRSPNLWWPDDRAWCVATEIDLEWTYVGGSVAFSEEVLANRRLEAQPASPNEPLQPRVPAWLTPALQDAVDEVLASGAATLRTWRGSVEMQLELPHDGIDGDLRVQRTDLPGSRWTRITERDPSRLRDSVTRALTWEVIQLR